MTDDPTPHRFESHNPAMPPPQPTCQMGEVELQVTTSISQETLDMIEKFRWPFDSEGTPT